MKNSPSNYRPTFEEENALEVAKILLQVSGSTDQAEKDFAKVIEKGAS